MKNCLACGHENPDDAPRCSACDTVTFVSTSPDALGGHIITPAEQRFWQRLTFRQFAVVLIRMQALWLLFYALYTATYLAPYLHNLHDFSLHTFHLSSINLGALLLILRIAMHLALAAICLKCADRITSWLIKDLVPVQPEN
jgi:hypothetical protein